MCPNSPVFVHHNIDKLCKMHTIQGKHVLNGQFLPVGMNLNMEFRVRIFQWSMSLIRDFSNKWKNFAGTHVPAMNFESQKYRNHIALM